MLIDKALRIKDSFKSGFDTQESDGKMDKQYENVDF